MPEREDSQDEMKPRISQLPPVDLSGKLAKEMLESLEERLSALGMDLEKAEDFLTGYDNFDLLANAEHPVAKAIIEVCIRHPELDIIYNEAFSMLKVEVSRKNRGEEAHSALKWLRHKFGS